MAQKCLEYLVVDGNYSKARIASLLLGLISIAFLTEANTAKDFEWDRIAVTCSDNEGNKIDTKEMENREECEELASNDENAKFIFYSDDKNCTMYKKCGVNERRVAGKHGSTYEKIEEDWKEYMTNQMTCGKGPMSFADMFFVDSLKECKEKASKFDDGRFIFITSFPTVIGNVTGCYLFNKCNSRNIHWEAVIGETYQRKIKTE